MPGSFFDTNVLIYLASGNTAKADRVEGLIAGGGYISVQVLNEIANVTRRKMRWSWIETNEFLGLICGLLAVLPITAEIHRSGLMIAERYGLSIYDSMIAAAALDAGCDTLWSEDMQNGLLIEKAVTVSNPFR